MRNESEIIQWVNSMSYADKLKVYLHYYNTQLRLNLEGVQWWSGHHEKTIRPELAGPTTISLNVLSKYHGRTYSPHPIPSFDSFISPEHVDTTDHGEDWKAKGWAQRIDTRISGIYQWLYRFQSSKNQLIPE